MAPRKRPPSFRSLVEKNSRALLREQSSKVSVFLAGIIAAITRAHEQHIGE
jgi:hypothetical protein